MVANECVLLSDMLGPVIIYNLILLPPPPPAAARTPPHGGHGIVI